MPVCDGCGAEVDEAHIRRRIERLELATRFRPIHIQVLLLDAAPPAELEDYFYRPAQSPSERSVASRMFFDELAKCVGHARSTATQEESTLAEFQKRGFFLAYAVECPVESSSDLAQAVNRLASTVLLRVNSSYKPKLVAPISRDLQQLIPLLQLKGWSEKLILHEGEPFDDPSLGDPQGQAEFGTSLGERLTKALLHRA
ncbi:MAG: hypothetical protein WA772_16175 [Candidatus Acidiferrales bacterium]